MNLRNNIVLKLFSLILLFSEFLNPAFFQGGDDFNVADKTHITCQSQKQISPALSCLTEESKDAEEKASRDCTIADCSVIHFPLEIAQLVPQEVATTSFIAQYSRFEVKPPLYRLKRALII